jgi:3-oxoacyl-[acyl-carrier protein] reductase
MPILTGKVALITGGSRGIGAAIVERLANDGASVAFTYTASSEKADQIVQSIRAKGGNVIAIAANAADPTAIKQAITQTAKQFGGLDIVVNNAGIKCFGPIAELTDELFQQALAINVAAAFYTVREASRLLRDGGRVIFIGSVNSDSMPFPGGSLYSLCKAAIAGFTRGLARDLGPRQITVNNIQPGPVDTDFNPEDGPSANFLKGMMALKRYARPEEIAALVSFLASPAAAQITGTGIKIDGGFDA